ncbi:MAG: hypothetical protein ABI693_08255 [Bryobacteraceae bacterium]
MPLPETLRVKLSSEAAGSISMTPVVVQQMAVREIVELMLPLTGKDVTRLRELLRRGSLVSGASRFRWDGFEAELDALQELVAVFPDSDPSLTFQPQDLIRCVLRGAATRMEIPAEAAAKKAFLKRRSFQDHLLELAATIPPVYLDYSYKDRADRFQIRLAAVALTLLREEANLLPFPALASQIRNTLIDSIELHTRR